jgi:aminopeptidase-like protein
MLDRTAHHVMRHRFGHYQSGGFRTIYGNDETVFEAPGYEIPTIALTRFPFPEYHTDHDTPDLLSAEALAETADVAFEICRAIEMNRIIQASHTGLICLSNPRYDLYRPFAAPGLDKEVFTAEKRSWSLMMNRLPRLMDGHNDLISIADEHGLPIEQVHDYVMQWVNTGLAETADDR